MTSDEAENLGGKRGKGKLLLLLLALAVTAIAFLCRFAAKVADDPKPVLDDRLEFLSVGGKNRG